MPALNPLWRVNQLGAAAFSLGMNTGANPGNRGIVLPLTGIMLSEMRFAVNFLAVMYVSSGYDDRQRDATPVDENVALGTFLFPYPLG